jgi:putative DNA primase/helicase
MNALHKFPVLDLVTEDSVALEFAAKHADELRYDHTLGKWFRWNGAIWQREDTKLAYSYARKLSRELAIIRDDVKLQMSAGRAAFCDGVERLAKSDRAFAVTSDIWDRDLWLLGTPDGTVDLRTGELRPADPHDYITKRTSVGPADTADCPIWLTFLREATRGDQAMIDFLQKWYGYSLTGDTREESLLFCWGPGGNGKGTMMNTIQDIFGDYCTTAAMDTFVLTKGDKHTTDTAYLARARLVITTEVEEGQVWAQKKINQLTGRDLVTCRFLYHDNFSFTPEFKLNISGNNKPRFKSVDDAARRRVNLAPFVNKPERPDLTLKDRLKAERPAILRWMIDGCLAWQQFGLKPPPVVQEATAEYFAAQDYFGQWLEECCIIDPTLNIKPAIALKSFQDWCKLNGEEVTDNRSLRGLIEKDSRFRYVTTRGTPYIRGLGLKPSEDDWHRDH